MGECLFAVFASCTEPLAGQALTIDINGAKELLKIQKRRKFGCNSHLHNNQKIYS